jgi:ATP-dependent helicase/nuclease subunit B
VNVRPLNLRAMSAGAAFLPELAALWHAQTVAAGRPLHDGLILLPTRRAARGLAQAFLTASAGAPLLLPRIIALGGLDEAPLALAGALALPPAIGEPHRRAVLARLILGMQGHAGAPTRADSAWALAGDLASLMDEAERAGIDLVVRLPLAAEPAHAEHWNRILDFLRIVTEHWPAYLREQGLMNPAARQVALMDAQAAAWSAQPPDFPVLAVSSAGDIPAVARLLRVIAALPQGTVVLPGLDTDLPDEIWQQLDEAHPQFGLAELLTQLGARRGDVAPITAGAPTDRSALLQRALLPSAAIRAWRDPGAGTTAGLSRLTPADPQEEAVCIALILRDALEQPRHTAALVTPDRALAQRVAAELARWGVVADDSAGEPLAQTPPAVFLRLVAAAVAQGLAPVPLLALLKHPLAGAGLPTPELRRRARKLELLCLRGPAPPPGLAGLRRAIDVARARWSDPQADEDDVIGDLLARLERCLEPVLRALTAASIPPADLMAALVAAAEALAATDQHPGPARLWALEEGEALAQVLAETLEALPALPSADPGCLEGLLDAVLEGEVVRSRRATRGRGGTEHPRIFIWGLLEARLQSADVIVLAGLTEGVWPPSTDPGPWMSRAMRARAGLNSPELRIGQTAHDFCMAACAAPAVVLSSPRRRDGAPAVPSRWLVRLDALLRAEGGLPAHPATSWAAQLDLPAAGVMPAAPPRPSPPVPLRPRRLNVTDIATLLRDPYEIYARRILLLSELEPLEQSTDFRDYGIIVHGGLDRYLQSAGAHWPADAAAALGEALHQSMRAAGVREALLAWWSPRLTRIAEWVDVQERTRRAAMPLLALESEVRGEWPLARPGGAFVLAGRADRIERRADGRFAILDYKTGTLPTRDEALMGREPQLLLEGAMVQAGGFGPEWRGDVAELTYWRLTGDHKAGMVRTLLDPTTDGIRIAVDGAADELAALIDRYDNPATAYPAQPAPPHGRQRPYAQLARAAEWGSAQDDSDTAESEE